MTIHTMDPNTRFACDYLMSKGHVPGKDFTEETAKALAAQVALRIVLARGGEE